MPDFSAASRSPLGRINAYGVAALQGEPDQGIHSKTLKVPFHERAHARLGDTEQGGDLSLL